MARLVWLAAVLLVACSAYAACALWSDRVAAVTCCERVEQAWTVLRSWSNACADERARAEATAERFAAMLLAAQSRTGSSATPLSMSLVCGAAGLSGPAVHAYLERALCAGLPLTHMDLVRSVYSPLMEEAPHNEDALTSDIAAACRARQLAWLANHLDIKRTLPTSTEKGAWGDGAAQPCLCDDMGDTAAVRYDRQVRLWGKSTQQQLMHTTVALYGVGGAVAEAAKNLVLAGIQAIAVLDDSPVRDVDGSANYLMQGEPGDTRGARARRSLQRLNPHVAVCDAAAALDAGASARVTVAAVVSVGDAAAHLRTATAAPGSDIVVLHAACGPTVLALFLYRRLSTHTLAEQWDRLVVDPAQLEMKPRGYQRVVLALHTRPTHGGFAAAAAAAYAAVERLRLSQITAADVQAVAQLCAGGGREDGSGDCVSATVAGACVAQHVIRQLGALAEAPPDAQSHRWMLCECGAEVECVVGL